MTRFDTVLSVLLVCLLVAGVGSARAEVSRSKHDFSGFPTAATRGTRSIDEKPGTCIYCHISHRSKPQVGRWSRGVEGKVYRLYESSTLEASLNQPTGSSRNCLSCHDGTLALGHSTSLPATVQASLRRSGNLTLGTDLSGDHPISFVYDTELANRKGELADPGELPSQVRLDPTDQLQCDTCHDPHTDKYGDFLVMDNRGSRLCTTCHRPDHWQESVHATSLATHTRGDDPWPHTDYVNVAENGCEACHRQHGAGHPEWLLTQDSEARVCLVCHESGLAEKDVGSMFRAFSFHPVEATPRIHSPNEDPLFMERHVTCSDCHEPHSIQRAVGEAAGGIENLGSISGVNASGSSVAIARSDSEVCYKCHGLEEEVDFLLTRQDNLTNTRLEFAISNQSFHPVETTGHNMEIQGLESDYTPSSMLSCSDCHGGDTRDSGGPRGPHGSAYEPILVREYQVVDPSSESFQSYALCYRCHDRSTLLADADGFPHRLHVVNEQASCAVCHDAHGSRDNPALINFLVAGKTGESVVTPSTSGLLAYDRSRRGSGSCSLTCHEFNHDPAEYPSMTPGRLRLRGPAMRGRPGSNREWDQGLPRR